METCPNCGATLRPNTRFCTTCGTRLHDRAPVPAGWGIPAEPSAAPDWSSWGAPAAGDTQVIDTSPAGRFEAASKSWTGPADQAPAAAPATSEPSFDFSNVPSPHVWDFGYGTSASPEVDEDDVEGDAHLAADAWASPLAHGWAPSPAPAVAAPAQPTSDVDAAGFSEHGTDEVDYLSGDENIEVSGPPVVMLPANKVPVSSASPIRRMEALVTELGELVSQLGGSDAADELGARIGLLGARAQKPNFSDVRQALEELRANPRDIDALRDFASQADRVAALLDDHARLTKAIDEAIDALR